MTEGHPAFVANNGRIGFGARRLRGVRARDRAATCALVWLAVRRDQTHLSLGAGVDEDELYDAELDARRVARSTRELRDLGLDPADYLLPAGAPVAVGAQARDHLRARRRPRATSCCLGDGRRTATARSSRSARSSTPSRPERHYVKTALSIQNMGFMRGLSPRYMAGDAGDQRLGRRASSRTTPSCAAAASGCCASSPRSATPATPSTGSRAAVAVPQDARRAVAREPGAAARRRASGWRRWPRCCTATPTARRSRPR